MKTEIIYCNLIVRHKNKPVRIEKCVYKEHDGKYHARHNLKKIGASDPVDVIEVERIKLLGYANE